MKLTACRCDLEIAQNDFTAVTGAQLRQGCLLNRLTRRRRQLRRINGVGQEPGRAVAKGPVGAARMPTPKANLGTVVLDGTGLESHRIQRAASAAVDTGSVARGDILGIDPFPRAHGDVANAAA